MTASAVCTIHDTSNGVIRAAMTCPESEDEFRDGFGHCAERELWRARCAGPDPRLEMRIPLGYRRLALEAGRNFPASIFVYLTR